MDRTQEKKNFEFAADIWELQKAQKLFQTKEEYQIDTRDIVRVQTIDALEDKLKNIQKINLTNHDTVNEKFT